MKKGTKKNLFFSVFVMTNILFIFLQIYKQTYFVSISYEKQRLEKEKESLIITKLELNQKLYEIKNLALIKDCAINKLKMQKIKLSQIKK